MRIRNTPKYPDPQSMLNGDMVQIDRNIPIPTTQGGRHGNSKYPWLEMEVGDSFLFQSRTKQNAYSQVSVHNGKHAPKRWITRVTPEGSRCWRIA